MVTQKITLDVAKDGIQANIIMVQGEANSRELAISLRNGKNPVELGAGVIAAFKAKKPDGTDLLNSCQVYTSSGVYPNTIIYNVTEGTVDTACVYSARIMLYNAAGELLWSPEFSITVKDNGEKPINNGSEAYKGEYTAMVAAMEAAIQSAEAAKEVSGKVGDLSKLKFTAETLVAAINLLEERRTELANATADSDEKIQNQIGNTEDLTTAAKIVVGAINEIAAGYVKKNDKKDILYGNNPDENKDYFELTVNSKGVTVPLRDGLGGIKAKTPSGADEYLPNNKYVKENFVPKSGDSAIDGTLSVKNLIVEGESSIANAEHLWVKEAAIVANADGVQLAGVYGYIIATGKIDGTEVFTAYGIVYEPTSDTLKLGKGEYFIETYPDGNGGEVKRAVFTFNDGEGQAIATRGDIADKHVPVWNEEKKTFEDSNIPACDVVINGGMENDRIPRWNAASKKLEDSGKSVSDFATKDAAQHVANALKGNVAGEIVSMPDISPLEHLLNVKVSGVDNVENVKLLVQGKNLSLISDFDLSTMNSAGNWESSPLIYEGYLSNDCVLSWEQDYTRTNAAALYIVGDIAGNRLVVGSSGATAGKYSHTIKAQNQWVQIRLVDWANETGKISNMQFELGTIATEHEPHKEPIEYTQAQDIISIYPCTTLTTDTTGALIECEYNRDINKAFAELQQAIISLGGNV